MFADGSVFTPPALVPPSSTTWNVKLEIPVSIKRLYDFADAVDLTLVPPQGVAGINAPKVTVAKDQEFRNSLREAGAEYEVVKNTLARIAVKGTQFEDVSEHFKGVTAIAWTDNDPVVLTKAIS